MHKNRPQTRHADLADALLELNSYDWIVFTSPNGVTMFFEFFFKGFEDLRDIGGSRCIACVGVPLPRPNSRNYILKSITVMPDEYVTAKIAKAFTRSLRSIEDAKILWRCAEVASPELPKVLEAMGAIVDDVACYKTVPETEDVSGAAAQMLESGANWITFTSSSTVENFHARFDLPALKSKKFPSKSSSLPSSPKPPRRSSP